MSPVTPAERMLMDLGIAEPKDIDLDPIAWTRGAIVNYRPIDRCEATIVGSTSHAVISINSRSMPERRRFSLAHELGSELIKSTIQERRSDRQRLSSFEPACHSVLRYGGSL